jgi:hypothetical protein
MHYINDSDVPSKVDKSLKAVSVTNGACRLRKCSVLDLLSLSRDILAGSGKQGSYDN